MYHILKSALYFGKPLPILDKIIGTQEELDLFLESIDIIKELNNQSYKDVILNLVENNKGYFKTYFVKNKLKEEIYYDYELFVVEVNKV